MLTVCPDVTSNDRRPLLARGLGLFSLGLGLTQLLAPDELARRTGLDDDTETRTVLRAVGIRELLVVPGLLRGSAPTGWLRARVAGDAMDLALLAVAVDGKRGRKRRLTKAAIGAVAGVTLLDLLAARRTRRRSNGMHLTAAITVNRPPEEVYHYWRDVENLPAFMQHLQSVRAGSDGRSHWTAAAPLGGKVEWDAEVVDDVPGERLAWRSIGRTRVQNRGEVRFTPAPGGRGTEVRVHLDYAVPGGKAGATVARLLGEDPHQQVEDDLRRFKQVLETGDVVRSAGSPEGTKARRQLVQRPGQPTRSR